MDTHVLTVQRQMVREDDEFVIKGVKTLQSVREIDVPKILHDELCAQRRFQNSQKMNYKNPNLPTAYQSKVESGYVIDKTGKQPKKLVAPNFICRKENGEFMTPHSVKYWAKEIQAREGIHFEFHKLRKTHLSYLAGMNVPAIELMKRAGHKKYDTSMKYYINRSEESKQYLLNTIGRISLTAPRYRVYFDPERKNPIEVSEEEAIKMFTQYSMIPKSYDDKSVSLIIELIDDGGGILPTALSGNTAPQTAPGKRNTPSQADDTHDGATRTHGSYTPLTAEAIAEALRATGKGDTADAIMDAVGADSN